MSGPFEAEAQVREDPKVRAVYAAFDADPGVGKMAPHNLAMLMDACADAGVAVGAYDSAILHWLAGWEPATVAVIAGLITRAHGDGVLLSREQIPLVNQALADAISYRIGQLNRCPDCDAADVASGGTVAACERHRADYEQTSRYHELGRRLDSGACQ